MTAAFIASFKQDLHQRQWPSNPLQGALRLPRRIPAVMMRGAIDEALDESRQSSF
jgi:hypothetical protein